MAGLNSFAVDAAAPKELHERGTALEIRCEKFRQLTDEIANLRNEMASLPASELLGGGHSAEIQRREIEAIEVEMALRKDLLKHADDVADAHEKIERGLRDEAKKLQSEVRQGLIELGFEEQPSPTHGVLAGVDLMAAKHPKALALASRARYGLARKGGDVHRGYREGQRRAIAELENRLEAIRQKLLSGPPAAAPVASEPPIVTGYQWRERQSLHQIPDGTRMDDADKIQRGTITMLHP